MNRKMGFLCEAQISDTAISALIRGELAIEAYLHAANLYSVGLVEVLTMMQSCASAAKLRAAGPLFQSASRASSNHGFPPPRIVNSAVR
jgi:hypothetical protein